MPGERDKFHQILKCLTKELMSTDTGKAVKIPERTESWRRGLRAQADHSFKLILPVHLMIK
jgi:hypothetical protein